MLSTVFRTGCGHYTHELAKAVAAYTRPTKLDHVNRLGNTPAGCINLDSVLDREIKKEGKGERERKGRGRSKKQDHGRLWGSRHEEQRRMERPKDLCYWLLL